MHRSFAYLFLFLYSYNLVGYLAVFSARQQQARDRVRQMMKASPPSPDLVLLAFHTPSLQQGASPLQWRDDHEFRYAGRMFDIVRMYCHNDTTYFLCIDDLLERQLIAGFEKHVQRCMGDPSREGTPDTVKDAFKDSCLRLNTLPALVPATTSHRISSVCTYTSIVLDIASPPPRLLPDDDSIQRDMTRG